MLAAALASLILHHADHHSPDGLERTIAAFGEADPAAVASTAADLQQRLGLSPRQPW